ncbi:hypothetical protein SISSUDRAFT_1069044 [Sistotremastrum suecicum HHB10207 ss-3]|uniref:Small ribosomal subunit protein mS29 n=1 Tax=Sistotremastrum suecicum HHB10207 ss-3 TaxID=1314776 RepID=A0A166HXZ0_9AGAM|nr:hypothetical protein SISSUDRAFT_1069044 [Sistotremastrum suecicum HHB10207 ss-3]
MPISQTNQLPQNIRESRLEPLNFSVFHPKILKPDTKPKALTFLYEEKDALRTFGVPKNVLFDFRLYQRPLSIIRDVTISTVDRLQTASGRSSASSRFVLEGASGSGKSYTLVQAVEYCYRSDWIVIYIPRAIKLVDSSTPYTYNTRTQTYIQYDAAFQILQRLLTVNRERIEGLTLESTAAYEHLKGLKAGMTLTSLIEMGLKDKTVVMDILAVVMEELGKQKSRPVLLAVDDFQALYQSSQYRDPNYQIIKSYHLSIPRLILEYASGKRQFARGAVVGAISTANPTYPLPLELSEALQITPPTPTGPWSKRSPTYIGYAAGLQPLHVPEQLQLSEAAVLFEVWMKHKTLHTDATDQLFLSKYTEASGNPRQFVHTGLLQTLET